MHSFMAAAECMFRDDSQLVEPIYVGWMPWNSFPYVAQPNHLVALVEKRYKIAIYYDPNQGMYICIMFTTYAHCLGHMYV